MRDDQAFIDALKAVGHQARLRILEAIVDGERNVSQIEEASGVTQPTLSQQLAVLRKSGLVRTRKDAKMVYYALDEEGFRALTSRIASFVGEPVADAPARPSATGVANFARLT